MVDTEINPDDDDVSIVLPSVSKEPSVELWIVTVAEDVVEPTMVVDGASVSLTFSVTIKENKNIK